MGCTHCRLPRIEHADPAVDHAYTPADAHLHDDQDAPSVESLTEVPGQPGYRRPAPDLGTSDAPPPDPTSEEARRRLRRLTCCCCGEYAPAYGQWWNRDTGYGLCPACVTYLEGRADYDREEFMQCYGQEGIHWLREYPEGG